MAEGVRVVFDQTQLDHLLGTPEGPTGVALLRSAVLVERVAKRLCPVDTGRLRGSITHDLARDARGLVATVGTLVEYAPFVEFGTRYMRAQPFLRPALAVLALGGGT
jgi:HK97 gp10 family phage protein